MLDVNFEGSLDIEGSVLTVRMREKFSRWLKMPARQSKRLLTVLVRFIWLGCDEIQEMFS